MNKLKPWKYTLTIADILPGMVYINDTIPTSGNELKPRTKERPLLLVQGDKLTLEVSDTSFNLKFKDKDGNTL